MGGMLERPPGAHGGDRAAAPKTMTAKPAMAPKAEMAPKPEMAAPKMMSGGALAAVGQAAPGAVAVVDDAAMGGAVEVTVLNAYDAASGRACKRVMLRPKRGGTAKTQVACAGADGWYWTAAALS